MRFPTRRELLQGALGLGWLGACASEDRASRLRPGGDRFCTVAYNVQAFKGWPEPAGHRPGDLVPAVADELAAYRADVITFSEAPRERLCRRVAERLQMRLAFFPSRGSWPGALLTKHELLSAETITDLAAAAPAALFTRHWGRAEILLNGVSLVVHSVHLHPTDAGIRRQEAAVVVNRLRRDLADSPRVILQGDLNHRPDELTYQQWLQAGLVDSFDHAGRGDGYTAMRRQRARIDYVFLSVDLAGRLVEARPLGEGRFRADREGARGYALSDHLPQLACMDLRTARTP